MLTWLLRNTKPKTSFTKVTGNGPGQNNLSLSCANASEEEVAEYLGKAPWEYYVAKSKQRMKGVYSWVLLYNSNANPAMKYVLGIPIRFLSSVLQTSCVLSEYKDSLPATAII